jgi:hypothetical protein
MSTATRIRQLGFRRWHERQFRWRDGGFKPLIMLVLIVAGIALCFKTVSIYFRVLFRAEHFAAQAVCGECHAYGALEVLDTSLHGYDNSSDAAPREEHLKVRCKKCGHAWTMNGETDTVHMGRPL